MLKHYTTLFVLVFLLTGRLMSQLGITSVYTDFDGYWSSTTGAINPVSPDNTHHLIAFEAGGTTYSTGVNDALLVTEGITYVPQDFFALPAIVPSTGGLIGIGSQFGGGGCVAAPYGNNVTSYLTDGINGLNLSTAIFNPGGSIMYNVSDVDPAAIGDGVPDLIVTQVGDYSAGANDVFRFLDGSGVQVGTSLNLDFTSAGKVSNLSWKFYTRGTPPSCGGSTSGNRDFRMIAVDFDDLGINGTNYISVAQFEHQLSSRSDIAFVGYNTVSINVLPVELLSFTAQPKNRKVDLIWHTASETNSDFFTIERSVNGEYWEKLTEVKGAGTTSALSSYQWTDHTPFPEVSYYRLSQHDFDGAKEVFPIESVKMNLTEVSISPNPAESIISISGIDQHSPYRVLNPLGQDLTALTKHVFSSNEFIQLNIKRLPRGMYYFLSNGKSYPFIIE